ncbi:replication endonuclease [Shewanella marina]|uniref:replication endonuclease n=1 Tax=Shewanella marina TaxID=487319 RepID=UPI00046E8553|nr:replication endonuclease [Shewanella marina]
MEICQQAEVDTSAIFVSYAAKADLRWAYKQLEQVPDDVAVNLFKEYARRHRQRARSANIWLRRRVAAMQSMLHQFPLPLWHLQTEIRRTAIATEWADRCASVLHQMTEFGQTQVDAVVLLRAVKVPADQWGFEPVMPCLYDYEQRKQTGEFEQDNGFYDLVAGAIARLVDEQWWRRQLEKCWLRYQEHAAIITGKVRRGVSAYVSRHCLAEFKQKQAAAQAWLNSMYAVNEDESLEILLADAVASSMSNPTNRRAELMVRLRGFEELADDMGYCAEFYTWTAPSRYHSWRNTKQGKCVANNKYEGASPRDTQAYLRQQWAKARAKLAREGIEYFGFRVAEPHHDGTPHWHLLLFIHPKQLRHARSIMRRYALEHDKHELAMPRRKRPMNHRGYRARFDFKIIDPEQSATGYLAKYIAKNVDGEGVSTDYEAESSGKHGAEGVLAWASMWGIRQFQQIGGPPVTVWRELRRLSEPVNDSAIIEQVRRAADSSNWRGYVMAMGGACCKRADRPVQLAKQMDSTNSYGEIMGRVKGVFADTQTILTRRDGWTISKFGLAGAFDFKSSDSCAPWSTDNNCTHLMKLPINDAKFRQTQQHLQLDEMDLFCLRAGAVLQEGKQQLRLRSDPVLGPQLLINRVEPPGWQAVERAIEDELAQQQQLREQQIRQSAWQVYLDGADVLQWWQSFSSNEQSTALEQLKDVLALVKQERFELQQLEIRRQFKRHGTVKN